MKINIKKIYKDSILPYKGSSEAACYDIIAHEILHTDINKVIVKLGFSTEIPIGYKGIIVPRSSFTHKGWVMQNSPGQIDSDYRGEWMIKFEAIPDRSISMGKLLYKEFPFKVGKRIAQIYFEKELQIDFNEVTEIDNSSRGEGGFGSTGE